MLAGVLLHVVEAPVPVDFRFHLGSDGERLGDEVPDFAMVVFLDRIHGDIEGGAAAGRGAEQTRVKGLTAAGGVKGSAVEGQLPYRIAAVARKGSS